MKSTALPINIKHFVTPIIIYCLITFFLGLGDALMSYSAPVYIEGVLKNSFLMGAVLSASSVFGLILDLLVDKYIPNLGYKKYLKIVFLTVFAFPIILLVFPPTTVVLLISMLVWGTYYEFKGFASYNFIHKHASLDKHTASWALVGAFSSVAYFVGPAVASLFIDKGVHNVFILSLFPFALAYIIFLLFTHRNKKAPEPRIYINEKEQRSFKEQFLVLFTLYKRIWPLFLFSVVIYLIDSSFWTVGILFTEELKDSSKWGSYLLSAYMAPSIFVAIIAPQIQQKFGKKRTAFITAIISGLLLIVVGRSSDPEFIVMMVFFMSVFMTVSSVLTLAVFEDYVARLGKFGNDMASLEQAAASISYIIGPLIWGGLAAEYGYHKTFALTGVLFASVAVACLAAVPRKILMPQTELSEIKH